MDRWRRGVAVTAVALALGAVPAASGAGPFATSSPPPDEVMYRLSVRFVGVETAEGLPMRRTTTYVAESVRPFDFTRTPSRAGPVYRFDAKVAGTLAHFGSGFGGPHLPSEDCTEAASRPVSGRVAVMPLVTARQNPAPLRIDVEPTPPTAIQTCVSPSGGGGAYPVYTLLPQAVWSGMLLYVDTKPVDLSKRYGRAFTLEYRMNQTKTAACGICIPPTQTVFHRTYTWTLKFTPVEPAPERTRWQVDVRGRDLWSWGVTAAGPGGRVWVDWLHRTVLEVEGDRVSSATGKVRVAGSGWISDPPGVFRIAVRTTERREYALRAARKSGSRVELNLLHDPGATYGLDFTLTLLPDALQRMQAAGVPDAPARLAELQKRGPVAIHEWGAVPSSPRLVFALRPGAQYRRPEAFAEHLPCRLFGTDDKDCFLTRGGEEIRVEKLG